MNAAERDQLLRVRALLSRAQGYVPAASRAEDVVVEARLIVRSLLDATATLQPWDAFTIEAMAVYGGGFVRALRAAYLAADADNQRRILEAFDPVYGEQYREMGERLFEREKRATGEVR